MLSGLENRGVHATAIVDPSAQIGENVSVGPFSVIGPKVTIGPGTRIGPHVFIERNTVVGRECSIHKGAVLGSDGRQATYTRLKQAALVDLAALGTVFIIEMHFYPRELIADMLELLFQHLLNPFQKLR